MKRLFATCLRIDKLRGRGLAAALWVVGAPACRSAPAVRAAEPNRALEVAVGAMLDDWHAAAARADEGAYFSHFAKDAVFMGTDRTERWDVPAFRAYAHPHFAEGKAWSFHAARRSVSVAPSGEFAWFDEDLDTPNLGPAHGSGVAVRDAGAYKLLQNNLSVKIPNERFSDVKRLLESAAPPPRFAPEPA